MAANPKVEKRSPKGGCGVSVTEGRLLTREELAVVLKVSLHTVDRMLAEEEIPCIKLRGWMVRFYMPEVIRVLVATATTRKRARGTEASPLAREIRNPKSEIRGQSSVISNQWPVTSGKGAK